MTTPLDLYCFDDLLVTCSQEIINNGFDSSHIPSTIKDWLSGKVLSALPKKLVQKLLDYIIQNRDMGELISYKENSSGEEFTLFLYKSNNQKARHQKKIKDRPDRLNRLEMLKSRRRRARSRKSSARAENHRQNQ